MGMGVDGAPTAGSRGTPPPPRGGAARFDTGPGHLLIADDEPLSLRALTRVLASEAHHVQCVQGSADFERALLSSELEVVLLALAIEEGRGPALLDCVRRQRPDVETVILADHASVEDAVGCMQRGAFDYFAKPLEDMDRVRDAVRSALRRARLGRWSRGTPDVAATSFPELIGSSIALRRVINTVEGLRNSESHVLIQGESGTGKELVARAIHEVSPRSQGPFVPVDCGALPEGVIESELFGHEKGAFTGAVGATGLFRMAAGGTLFLDEIGEIPLPIQAKLLRALQYKEVRPVGGSSSVPIDIRVVSATHRDLAAMVELGRFRMDLYYRLHVVRIEIPSLRERPEDIPALVQHFLEKHEGGGGETRSIEEAALQTLLEHDWPGNVRELENVIESALVFARGPRLRDADLPLVRGRGRRAGGGGSTPVLPLSLEAYERSALERALREAGGNATDAAQRLGIGRSTFYRKLSKHGIREAREITHGRGVGSTDRIR